MTPTPEDDMREARRIADLYAWGSYGDHCAAAISAALLRARAEAWEEGADAIRVEEKP